MTSSHLIAILDQKVEILINAFKSSKNIYYNEKAKKIIHAPEYGSLRERACKEFLEYTIPQRLKIGNGFVINSKGDISTQCDIVIYDRENTPFIETEEKQRFFPIECVCAIGEIKSTLTKNQLKITLNKLAKNKIIRESIVEPNVIKKLHNQPFNAIKNVFDHCFTFIICNKLDFALKNIHNEIDSYYDEKIEPWQKHNVILSINDGLILYTNPNGMIMMYPFSINGGTLRNHFIQANNGNLHFYQFINAMMIAMFSSTLVHFEISHYLGDPFKPDNENTEK